MSAKSLIGLARAGWKHYKIMEPLLFVDDASNWRGKSVYCLSTTFYFFSQHQQAKRRSDLQPNDTWHDDTLPTDTQHTRIKRSDIQRKDTQLDDTQHNNNQHIETQHIDA